jgi:hypothetical protein
MNVNSATTTMTANDVTSRSMRNPAFTLST